MLQAPRTVLSIALSPRAAIPLSLICFWQSKHLDANYCGSFFILLRSHIPLFDVPPLSLLSVSRCHIPACRDLTPLFILFHIASVPVSNALYSCQTWTLIPTVPLNSHLECEGSDEYSRQEDVVSTEDATEEVSIAHVSLLRECELEDAL